jgi:hypothetical protein
MILTIETTLHGIARMLHERIGPAVQDPYAGEAARLAELLLKLNANWIDDAAAVRVDENAAIRGLLGEGATLVANSDLAERLAGSARSADPGLRISELDKENNRLRSDLLDLHAHVDALEGNAARLFRQRIWRSLAEFEMARAPR